MNLHSLQGRLTVFLMVMCTYSGIVTIFYVHTPVKKYRYLSVHNKKDYARYPMFNPRSHCSGCDRLMLNAGDSKTISDIDFLVLVSSAPGNKPIRQRIRGSWAKSPSAFRRRQLFFFIGLPDDKNTQNQIYIENSNYKDIIQPGFRDTFLNQTLKSLSILYWVHYRLADRRFHPKVVLKLDDDNLVDIYKLETYLKSIDLYDDEIMCSVREEAVPDRLSHQKRFIDARTWNEPLYPRCCFSGAYVIAPSAISSMIEAHESGIHPFIPYEEFYITGVLTRAANITLTSFRDDIYSEVPEVEKVITHSALTKLGGWDLDVRWELIQKAAFGEELFMTMMEQKELDAEMRKEFNRKHKELMVRQGILNDTSVINIKNDDETIWAKMEAKAKGGGG